MAVPLTSAMQGQIANLYISILGRNPDPVGFGYWCDVYANANGTQAALDAIASGFGKSPEFTGIYSGQTVTQAVNLMYTNIIGRPQDTTGAAYWTNYATNLITSGKTVGDAYALTANAMMVAALGSGTTDATNTLAKQQAAITAGTAAPTTTYTLTTGVDTASASQFTGLVDGAAPTFTALDALTGKNPNASANTLRLIDGDAGGPGLATADITPIGATLTNIGNLEIIAQDDIGTLSTAGTLFTGVTNVTVSNAGAITALTAGSGQALTATNTAVGANNIAYQGGTNLNITNTGVLAGNAAIGSTTAPTGTVVYNSAGVYTDGADNTLGTIGITGGTVVTVTALTGVTAAQRAAATTDTSNNTITQGAVTVTGTSVTRTVSVTQSTTVAEVDSATVGKIGETAGAVTVNDANRNSATAAGTITTVTINNAGATAINSGALTTLNLAGTLTTVDAGTLGALTTAANTALAVNLTGATIGTSLTIDPDITTINISGNTTASTVASLVNASATAVNISGAAAVTLTAITLNANTVFTSTNTAGTTITAQLGNAQQFVGGDGADSISISQTTKAINLGAGNDVAIIDNGTLGVGGTLNGGAGVNTIVANTNGSTISANANITNFTTLRVAGAAAQGTHNATGFTALEVGLTGTNLAGAVTFSNVAANTGLTYLATTGQNSTYTLANATGTSDILNVTLRSVDAINVGTLTAAGVETVNITLTDTDTTAQRNTMTLVAVDATTITLTGNAGLSYTNDNTNTKVSRFDASGVVGAAADAANLAVSYTSNTTVANSATTTILGGSGNDSLTGGLTADTINGNAGNDVIDGGRGADVIDGGAGTNTFTAVASGIANVEGAGTGTTDGMAINLGSTAVTAATINGAMGGTIGLSGASTSLAAGTAQYVFATQSNLFATTTDTLANIQNITGTASNDYIVGSTVNNVITGAAGIDQIILGTSTAGGSDTIKISAAAASGVDRDIISGFTAGAVTTSGQADVFNLNTGVATLSGDNNFTSAAAIQAGGNAGNVTMNANAEVLRITAGTIADITAAGSLDGTNLLGAAGQNGTITTAAAAGKILIAIGITGGGTAIYYGDSGAGNTALVANEITLIGVLSGVAVGDLVFSNFSNVA